MVIIYCVNLFLLNSCNNSHNSFYANKMVKKIQIQLNRKEAEAIVNFELETGMIKRKDFKKRVKKCMEPCEALFG